MNSYFSIAYKIIPDTDNSEIDNYNLYIIYNQTLEKIDQISTNQCTVVCQSGIYNL